MGYNPTVVVDDEERARITGTEMRNGYGLKMSIYSASKRVPPRLMTSASSDKMIGNVV